MTVPKTLSRTKTHVRCGTPDCDWGTPMPSFSEGRIGPMPSRIPAALYRAPWPGSKDAERICWFDLKTLTLTLLHRSKNGFL